jgi:sugar phosphate isomerase/epimerase
MFKLAAFTDEISHDLERACRVCREFGVEGVELRGVWQTPPHQWTSEQRRDMKRILGDYGLTVCSIASPFGKCELDNPAEVAAHMSLLRTCADHAREFGCRLVRGFAFWKRTAAIPWDSVLKAYEPVPGILEECDVLLGLENEAACNIGTAGHTRHFLDRLARERIKVVWDPANHVQDPDGAAVPAYPDGYELLRPDIVHVHVKDAASAPDGTVPNVFLGEGVVDWDRQLQALKNDGYTGFVSLETHVTGERFPESLRPRYGHYLTGDGREGASKVCLAWLRDAMAAL